MEGPTVEGRRPLLFDANVLLRGLRPIVALVQSGHLGRDKAMAVVNAMRHANPYFLTQKIVEAFRREIGVDL